ncbi:response regulator transcription factor [Microcystis sp. M061S2]|uniref:response regulator n=1 Tax=Microcystis sp. M061S2 TaxID=2771171 RepID=UPI002587DD40|nr:response regulator transcription factor [Microcystis sp. M061S2]MCA2654977.1 response regulator transcription factor [Microcystis sp. M061S2]
MITSETSRERKIIMKPIDLIKVLIADDHDLTCLGLKTLISQQPHCQVVGIAVNGQQAIDLAKSCQPDVIILDVRMPILDGHSAAIQIKQFDTHVRIIAYSSLANLPMEKNNQTTAFDLYCCKDISSQDLIKAIDDLGKLAQSDKSQFRRVG